MILLAAEGWRNDEIAEQLHCRREVAAKWRKRFFERRLAGLDDRDRPGRPRVFPPEVIVQVKAPACELPSTHGVPLARWSRAEFARHAQETGLVGAISGSTIWRWLSKDAIRPWQHRSWLFPRDPQFAQKAAPVLDLYQRSWKGQPLHDDEFVISADEKTSIQARHRIHSPAPTRPGRAMRVEHEYQRRGAWAYLAALDVHRAQVIGRCETQTGIAPFRRLVEQVMTTAPYRQARCVFWVVGQHRSWLFPRDPQFAQKAAPVLDLYQRSWKGQPLHDDEFVISADEKTSIQARHRIHSPAPARPGRAMRVEHEYQRRGAWAYLAALDVHRAQVIGRCEAQTGITPFRRLVEQVMTTAPYRQARCVFWVVDNGSSHRGARSIQRAKTWDPRLQLVHTPCHASWLNQIEIYFSIVQRKVLTPNDFASTAELADRLHDFEGHFARIAKPFEWTFTRDDLDGPADRRVRGHVLPAGVPDHRARRPADDPQHDAERRRDA